MIITRSPLRLPLGGGGTDLPSYYERFGGFCISAAIDRYVYITLHENFQKGLILKYSSTEHVQDVSSVQNPIIRAALQCIPQPLNLEICSMSDVPGETGLGSSSAFTAALLSALHTYMDCNLTRSELAELSCNVEKSNPGKQDQYASVFGGLKCFTFKPLSYVETRKLEISSETLANLEENLLLVFTGFTREASQILSEQDRNTAQDHQATLESLHRIKAIGEEIHKELKAGNLEAFAELLNVHWAEKKNRSLLISTPQIDEWYEYGLKYGALGGKLVGAGGGGFLLFYCKDKARCRHALTCAGLREVRFHFDFEGTKVL